MSLGYLLNRALYRTVIGTALAGLALALLARY